MAPRRRRQIATASVLCGLVVAAFEGTVVTSAMPTIARDLSGMGAYSWVFSAFLLASTVGVVACGKLADSFGRRPVFVGGMTLFLLGSALCGSAHTMEQLVAYRVVQGLGAGAIQPIAMTISADLYTLEERARIQALFTSAWGAANVVGPILGGLIVMHASWRWVFFVNVPVGAIAIALLSISYRDPPRDGRAQSDVWRSLRSNRAVRAGLVGSVAAGALLYLCAAYVPLWMTTHAHRSAVDAGAALVPLLVGWAFGSSFGVKVLVRRGMRASTAGGFSIALVGASAFALVTRSGLDVRLAFVALAVLGAGIGPAASTCLVGPQSSVAWSERGAITSAIYAARMLGGSIAVTVLGGRHAGADVRFDGLVVIALLAALLLYYLAPRTLDAPSVLPRKSMSPAGCGLGSSVTDR